MTLIHKLLYDTDVSFHGQYYECEGVTVYPKPLQKHIPVYLATSDDEAIAFAALNSFGLMGGAPFSMDTLKSNVAKYRAINSNGFDRLMLARFFFVAPTYDEAVSDELHLGTLALNPCSLNLQKNLESLTRYNQEVQNYV